MTRRDDRILHLTHAYHALQRFAERVGDFKPKPTLNLDNGEATLRKSQPEYGSVIYAVKDRGRLYRLVVSETRQGNYIVLTVKPDAREGYHPPRARSRRKAYNRRAWKTVPPGDED